MGNASKPTDFFELLAILLMGLGVIFLFTKTDPKALALFLIFAGGSVHYFHSLRAGVISSRFYIFRWHWSVDRDESPFAFMVAAIIEGLWLALFFFVFLFSL